VRYRVISEDSLGKAFAMARAGVEGPPGGIGFGFLGATDSDIAASRLLLGKEPPRRSFPCLAGGSAFDAITTPSPLPVPGTSPLLPVPDATPPSSPMSPATPKSAPISVTPTRRSGRHVVAEDWTKDAMQKAMRCKAERNLDTAGISPSSKAFSSFSSTRISSNMSSV
jgi:hypothetical protein